jgi:hypothetical protein
VQFLEYIVTQGQSYAPELQFAPLPASVVQVDLGLIAKINYGGARLVSPTTSTTSASQGTGGIGQTTIIAIVVVVLVIIVALWYFLMRGKRVNAASSNSVPPT